MKNLFYLLTITLLIACGGGGEENSNTDHIAMEHGTLYPRDEIKSLTPKSDDAYVKYIRRGANHDEFIVLLEGEADIELK